MMTIANLVRPNILAMKAYSSARDEYSGLEAVTLLDANENPFENGYNRYPDPYQQELKQAIAKFKNIKASNIFLGNGSDEAIDLVFRIFCEPGQDNVIITNPTYGMYEVAAAIQNIEVRKVPLTKNFEIEPDKMLAAADSNSKLMFICSPNNPSGNLLNRESIVQLLVNFNGIIIIDEAYIDFSDEPSFIRQIGKYDNLIVLQTLSKAWGLAGLRMGMAFTNEYILALLNKVKAPYNLNVLTQKKCLEIIKDSANDTQANIDLILAERNKLMKELKDLPQVKAIFPSDTNFLLVRFDNHKTVYETLKNNKVIVRDRSNNLNCEGCLRITVGTPEENKRTIEILKS